MKLTARFKELIYEQLIEPEVVQCRWVFLSTRNEKEKLAALMSNSVSRDFSQERGAALHKVTFYIIMIKKVNTASIVDKKKYI